MIRILIVLAGAQVFFILGLYLGWCLSVNNPPDDGDDLSDEWHEYVESMRRGSW